MKNPLFNYKGRNYEDAVRKGIQMAKSEAEYPSSSFHQGIKTLHGERHLFRMIVAGYLRKAGVPKKLIQNLNKT